MFLAWWWWGYKITRVWEPVPSISLFRISSIIAWAQTHKLFKPEALRSFLENTMITFFNTFRKVFCSFIQTSIYMPGVMEVFRHAGVNEMTLKCFQSKLVMRWKWMLSSSPKGNGRKREGRKDIGSHISFSLSGKIWRTYCCRSQHRNWAAENVGFEGRCTGVWILA